MRKSLHDTGPRQIIIRPSSIRIELLVVFNEWLLKDFAVRNVASTRRLKGPYFWKIDHDDLINEILGVPLGDQADGFVGGCNVGVKVACFEDTSGLEPLADTWFTRTCTCSVVTLGDPSEVPRSKGVVNRVVGERCALGIVPPGCLTGVQHFRAAVAATKA